MPSLENCTEDLAGCFAVKVSLFLSEVLTDSLWKPKGGYADLLRSVFIKVFWMKNSEECTGSRILVTFCTELWREPIYSSCAWWVVRSSRWATSRTWSLSRRIWNKLLQRPLAGTCDHSAFEIYNRRTLSHDYIYTYIYCNIYIYIYIYMCRLLGGEYGIFRNTKIIGRTVVSLRHNTWESFPWRLLVHWWLSRTGFVTNSTCTHSHTHIYTYIHHTYIHMHTLTHTYIYTYIHHTYIHTHAHTHTHTHVYIHTSYIHTHTHLFCPDMAHQISVALIWPFTIDWAYHL